jgi:hypothetical protein
MSSDHHSTIFGYPGTQLISSNISRSPGHLGVLPIGDRLGQPLPDLEVNSAPHSTWIPHEAELLAVRLQLLQKDGYGGVAVDRVAAISRASKATVYRRWPTKSELVLAAFREGIRDLDAPSVTGSLREDLLASGERICTDALKYGGTIRGLLSEMSSNTKRGCGRTRVPWAASGFDLPVVDRRSRPR